MLERVAHYVLACALCLRAPDGPSHWAMMCTTSLSLLSSQKRHDARGRALMWPDRTYDPFVALNLFLCDVVRMHQGQADSDVANDERVLPGFP